MQVIDFVFLMFKDTKMYTENYKTLMKEIIQSRNITLPTKVHLVKVMVFQWSCMYARVGL